VVRTTWQDKVYGAMSLDSDCFSVFMLEGDIHFVGVDDRHVDEDDGHHVEVGVGVLPSRKRRRCYSGL
jgi:hypothetical protein